ncbi:MAG TPA: hypothetical protein VFJ82_18930 [Longimicrobium sp.]|nr:hypothetical protein [Longimicrobium sp.]
MPTQSPPSTCELREQLLNESSAMARYALASGMTVPAAAADAIERARFADPSQPMNLAPLVKAHDQLSRLVAPATPRALIALGDDRGGRVAWLGSVGLVRRMLAASIISVIVFVALSITKVTNTDTGPGMSFANSSGWPLLANELFWMASAGIGASFAMLMQVNGYIVKRTYDPKYEPTYWIKFILGVMAGFILVALIPIGGNAQPSGTAGAASGVGGASLALPTLAMLGGFSASAVYRILAKLVESVEAVFRGSPAEEMAQRERAAQTRASEEVSQARMRVAAQIVGLQQQVSAGADPATLTQQLSSVLNSLAPTGEHAVPETPAPPVETPAATVSLPNIPIVSAPADLAPAASVDAPAAEPSVPTAAAADVPTPVDESQADPTPVAAYAGGDEGEDMSGGDEAGEAGPAASPTGENDGTQTGAVG